MIGRVGYIRPKPGRKGGPRAPLRDAKDRAMQIERHFGHAPKAHALGEQILTMTTPCVGCEQCQGLCDTLLELLSLPEAVLHRDRAG